MSKIYQNLVYSLPLPLIWVVALIMDLVIFADGPAKTIYGRVFEDVVIFCSFFFYNASWISDPLERTFFSYLKPMTLQFFFWWSLGFIIVTLVRRQKAKK